MRSVILSSLPRFGMAKYASGAFTRQPSGKTSLGNCVADVHRITTLPDDLPSGIVIPLGRSSGSVVILWRPPGCKWTETHGWLDFWLVVLPVLPYFSQPCRLVAGEVKTGLWSNPSELAKGGASDGKESIITEAAAESSATDEIEVPFGSVAQGEARDSEYSLLESSQHWILPE